jgi:iron(III) transport system ATP-binding protein
MSELRIHDVHQAFDGHPVLHGIDLTVQRGSLLALLGPSGSGKTTLLRIVCGFERARQGTVEIDGRLIAGPGVHVPPEQRHIGYVPQEGALFPHLSVADNISFGLPRAQRRKRHRVAELLEMVGLPSAYADRVPQQLSGGQQQRVALARALAPEPSLVMLDEPFSALDTSLRLETRAAVVSALKAAGATAVLVTHDQPEALSLGDAVAVLWQGRLLQTAVPETLYREPVSRELASFVGDAVLLPGRVHAGIVECALGRLPLRTACADGAAEAMLRPEQIRVQDAQASRDGGAQWYEATVESVSFGGQDASVYARLAQTPELRIQARVPGYRCPAPGAVVAVAVDGDVTAYPR